MEFQAAAPIVTLSALILTWRVADFKDQCFELGKVHAIGIYNMFRLLAHIFLYHSFIDCVIKVRTQRHFAKGDDLFRPSI